MREKKLLNEIILAASELGVPLWRNNVGVTTTDKGHRIRYGLGTGSADLIGILPPDGRFFAVEVKTENTPLAAHQKQWIEAIRKHGGRAVVARSVEDVTRAIRNNVAHRFYAAGDMPNDLDYYYWQTTTDIGEVETLTGDKVFEVTVRELED
jgi:hypothetical protein